VTQPKEQAGVYLPSQEIAATSLRSDLCGALRKNDVGRNVALCGWASRIREHGEHLVFVDLRDASGIIQCVVDASADLHAEYIVRIEGVVRDRPKGTINDELPTGEVEIQDCQIEVLSAATPPPFPIDERISDTDETTRLKYRFIDLRRDRMQQNLRIRARVNSALRDSMASQGFTEIETPLLIASTPEGARDFIVPSRLKPGNFYALPQSPQLFKQLCMVGGLDRYFQLARCLRDEDLRADRQFEFTQYDMEMSFVTQEDVLKVVTNAVKAAAKEITGDQPADFPRMTWHEAMERYGSDKPDIRFGMELIELTEIFSTTEFNAFRAPCIKGILVPGGGEFPRSRLDQLTELAKQYGAKGLVWMKVENDRSLTSPVRKFLSTDECSALVERTKANAGDLLLLVADERQAAQKVLGLLRLELGRPPLSDGGLNFLWVIDFPLFEGIDDETGQPIPAHHPFTRPHPDDMEKLESDPLAVRSQAYDLVLNGWELGSGSIRIHEPELQQRIFSLLGIPPDEAQCRFGFLLDAFRYGAPPHGGFAFGTDRLSALLAGEENIREVIAFPKTQSGLDPLTGAPTEVDAKDLKILGINVAKSKK
jgi:aspartyl-tRNA synthetase